MSDTIIKENAENIIQFILGKLHSLTELAVSQAAAADISFLIAALERTEEYKKEAQDEKTGAYARGYISIETPLRIALAAREFVEEKSPTDDSGYH